MECCNKIPVTIHRGCTDTNIFRLPFGPEGIEELYITYQQDGKTVLEKTLNDCEWGERNGKPAIRVRLSREDTLKFFQENGPAEVQVYAGTKTSWVASDIKKAGVSRLLKETEGGKDGV